MNVPCCALILLLTTMLAGAANDFGMPLLSRVFGDHMVLQRGKTNVFWGWCRPGERVTVSIAGRKTTAVSDSTGKWEARITPPSAGGPYTIQVQGPAETLSLSNVLVGDVWLCGGQSNMEFPLERARNGISEAQAADFPGIRLFTVAHNVSYSPSEDIKGSWKQCSPEDVRKDGGFSAVAYFFGRKLHRDLNVPIGLIQSCWGGTTAEAWTSPSALEPLKDFAAGLAKVEDLRRKGGQSYGNYIMHWYDEFDVGQKNVPWFSRDLDESDWTNVSLRKAFKQLGVPGHPTVCYFRRKVELPDPLPAGKATIHLGIIERMDTVYVNGQWVGASAWVENPRNYTIPAGVLVPGTNLVTVRVFKTAADGGFRSDPGSLRLELENQMRIPLSGAWKGKVSVDAQPPHPLPLGFENWPVMPGVLFQGMIEPISPMAISGAIWYQGESNVGRAAQYRSLLPAMIADWRRTFQQGEFPFYIVSLPAHTPRSESPGGIDSWTELREAQAFVAKTVTNAGLAITIDTGDAHDVHPVDKLEVGERLALTALAGHYKRRIVAAGPMLARVEKLPGALRVHFSQTDGGLILREASPGGFAVAGNDRKWAWATATLEGDSVVLSAASVSNPEHVRYAWQANPHAVLFNGAGLPAAPFRTDEW